MSGTIQTIIITSDKQAHCLPAFAYLWNKYNPLNEQRCLICGFSRPPYHLPGNFSFYSIGKWEDYPAGRWSDALIHVLDNVADEVFILMLDDYWLTRPVDVRAIKMIYDYMFQFQNVIKFDITDERLYADGGGKYLWGYNTYDTLGYLDLIKSNHASPYHLSLWGGMWRRDLLRDVLVPGETAQQIELNGTHRLSQYGDELLVLGTRQIPLKHANVIQRGQTNTDATTGMPALKECDREELKRLGFL